MKTIFLLIMLLLTVSCASRLEMVGFTIDAPEISHYYRKVHKPLVVNIISVSDTIIVTGNEAKKLIVTDYRESLKNLIRTTFRSTYDTIIFNEQKYQDFRHKILEDGTTLLITDVYVHWYYSGYVHNYENRKNKTGCHVSFEYRIYRDGKPRSGGASDAKSELSTPKEKNLIDVFLDGQNEFAKRLYARVLSTQ